jgi:hypothetical protein
MLPTGGGSWAMMTGSHLDDQRRLAVNDRIASEMRPTDIRIAEVFAVGERGFWWQLANR